MYFAGDLKQRIDREAALLREHLVRRDPAVRPADHEDADP
jgi:hypothetical protein